MQWIPQNLPEETDNQGEQQTQVKNHEPVLPNIIEDEPSVPNTTTLQIHKVHSFLLKVLLQNPVFHLH